MFSRISVAVCTNSDTATQLSSLTVWGKSKTKQKKNTLDVFGVHRGENQRKITKQNNQSVLPLKSRKSKDNGTKAPWGGKNELNIYGIAESHRKQMAFFRFDTY